MEESKWLPVQLYHAATDEVVSLRIPNIRYSFTKSDKWGIAVNAFILLCDEDAGTSVDGKTSWKLREGLGLFNHFICALTEARTDTQRVPDEVKSKVFEKNLQALKLLADQLYCICWDKLHSGPWDRVSPIWRSSYAFCCLTLSLLCSLFIHEQHRTTRIEWKTSSMQHSNHSSRKVNSGYLNDSYYYADMGLILGGSTNAFAGFLFSQINLLDDVADALHDANAGCDDSGFEDSSFRKRKIPRYNTTKKTQTLQIPIKSNLPFAEFKQLFFDQRRPVLIKHGISQAPAVEKWRNLKYIRSKIGRRTVPIEIGSSYTSTNWSQKLMTISEFLDNYIETNAEGIGYLAQHEVFEQIPSLEKDLLTPDYVYCGDEDVDVIKNFWFGPAGTISPLHIDRFHNIFAQIVGLKYVRLYTPEDGKKLYPFSAGPLTNTSQIEFDLHSTSSQDLERMKLQYPEFTETPYYEVYVDAGDLLYIPMGWWHFVKSLTQSTSVSFWFK